MSEIDLLIQELRDTIDNQREEIERLNNIINELEKDIKIQLSQGGPREIRDLVDGYDILDKLKELKENK